jgi:hypothetical protein
MIAIYQGSKPSLRRLREPKRKFEIMMPPPAFVRLRRLRRLQRLRPRLLQKPSKTTFKLMMPTIMRPEFLSHRRLRDRRTKLTATQTTASSSDSSQFAPCKNGALRELIFKFTTGRKQLAQGILKLGKSHNLSDLDVNYRKLQKSESFG